MDIFKLFFNHDQRLDKLAKRNANKSPDEIEATLDDFMTPTPTYSKFYLTGTLLEEEKFGLDTLQKSTEVIQKMDEVFSPYTFLLDGNTADRFSQLLPNAQIGDAMILFNNELPSVDTNTLKVDDESNVGHFKSALRQVLEEDHLVIYKEKAHHGFDLHLFSKKNLYPNLFQALQPLVNSDFRFFSINSKRMRSERHFYFETWTLDKPPHGAEEVFTDTVL